MLVRSGASSSSVRDCRKSVLSSFASCNGRDNADSDGSSWMFTSRSSPDFSCCSRNADAGDVIGPAALLLDAVPVLLDGGCGEERRGADCEGKSSTSSNNM